MILAIRTGVPAADWLEDTRALMTAVVVFNEHDSKRR